ncbi:tetratricopeptide repeat protein [Chryseolinea lacunae]|uniref:Tetratricopeptide repeat protein n=1 Tax=Chryseolinea lacunae TaxID=2801331 RepID=A0ABS1L0C7_9BACT|nr:tetratricopeptide repeat protein [Chryseolinea lacunae]MBL0745158.1 tetratricopeptide repeat protein [Chryseolinea lacunae]
MTNDSSSGSSKNKTRLYFALSVFFLFAMALFSSVDGSFVSIFLGIAVLFFSLGLYTRTPHTPAQRTTQNYAQKDAPFTAATFLKVLGQRFAKGQGNRGYSDRAHGNANAQQQRSKLVVVVFVVFMFSIFITILLSVLSGGDGPDADYYFQMAEQEFVEQQYDSARVHYRKAWQRNDDYKEAFLGHAKAMSMLNQNDSAILLCDRALAIDADMTAASYTKAAACFNLQRYDDAIAILTPLVEDNPDDNESRLLLADTYYTRKEYDTALPLYEKVYADEASRTRMLCHVMAYLYDTKGEEAKAIPLYQEALQYDSSVVEIYQRLGELMPGDDGNVYRVKATQLNP